MEIKISCPYCSKLFSAGDSLHGKIVYCPGCYNPVQVPLFRGTKGTPRELLHPATRIINPPALTRIRLAAILNIVIGIVTLLAATCVAFGISTPYLEELEAPDEMARFFEHHLYVASALLNMALGVLMITAGALMEAGKKSGRTLGIIAGFACCVSFWSCCTFILRLGCGVYTLIILFREETKYIFETGTGSP